MTDDELTGYLVDTVDILVDDLSGDVGMGVGGDVLILSPELAESVARDLLTATRKHSDPRPVTTPAKAKWARA